MDFKTIRLPEDLPEEYLIAPDGSLIRPLVTMHGGSLAHCTLVPNATSLAVRHKTVEEIWYILEGRGRVWRKSKEHESVEEVFSGSCITIPTGTCFQFCCTLKKQLRFIIITMPHGQVKTRQ